MVGGDQKLGVENGALGIGALGTVGKVGQVSLPGGDGLVELLLPLEDLGVLKGCRHGQLGLVTARLVGLDLEAIVLEERGTGPPAPGRSCRGPDRWRRSGRRPAPPADARGRPRENAEGRRRPGSCSCRRADWECRTSRESRRGRWRGCSARPCRRRPASAARCRVRDRSRSAGPGEADRIGAGTRQGEIERPGGLLRRDTP